MFERKKNFLGEHFISRKLLTDEDIIKALNIQKKQTQPFTEAALQMGVLNLKQTFQLMTKQRDSDLSLKEMCRQQKLLNEDQIQLVESHIKTQKPGIGDIMGVFPDS